MERATNGNVIVNLGLSSQALSDLKKLTGTQLQAAVDKVANRLEPQSAEVLSLQEGTTAYLSALPANQPVDAFAWEARVVEHYNSQPRQQVDPLTAFAIGFSIGMVVALALS